VDEWLRNCNHRPLKGSPLIGGTRYNDYNQSVQAHRDQALREFQLLTKFIKIVADFSDYFDSGILVKIYHLEAGSKKAALWIQRAGPIPFPFFAEMEIRTFDTVPNA
jgi:hypothetical protein